MENHVKKCPNCGEPIPSLFGVCPYCEYVIDANSKDSEDLMALIDEMEKALTNLKSGMPFASKQKAIVEQYHRKAYTLYGDNHKVRHLLAEIDAELEKYQQKKHKKKVRNMVVLGVLVLLLIYGYVTSIIIPNREAERQYTELCSQLDALGVPSAKNYNEYRHKLSLIVWAGDDTGFLYKFGINQKPHKLKISFEEKKYALEEHLESIKYKMSDED